MIPLTLYIREYCHLCQHMLAALAPYQDRIALTVRDIDDDDEWEARYALLIPVLMSGEVEICHYHLNPQRLDALLAEVG